MPTWRNVLLLGVFIAALGCTSAPPPATVSVSAATQAPAQSASAPPAVEATGSSPGSIQTALASPAPLATPGPAWQAVLGQIDADGKVSKDTALQAFSLAIGPLPGVSVPSGDPGLIHSGSMAVRWLVSYWDQLSGDQQQAAIALLPELDELQHGATLVRLASQNRTNDYYTLLAQQQFAEIGAHLQDSLNFGLTITARVGLTDKATSGAEATVLGPGGKTGKATKCVIVVAPWLDGQPDNVVKAYITHEVFHCYEGAIVGLDRYWGVAQNPAPWLTEGAAEWVAATLVPESPESFAGSWSTYLNTPSFPLLQQAYSAIGFYAQLDQAGQDPWTTLVGALQAADNTSAFAAAGGSDEEFLDQWAAGFLRDPSRGDPWAITGPAITNDTAVPGGIHLNNGGSVAEQVAPYTNDVAVFAETPDVLEAAISGPSRISDANGHDYLVNGRANFCMLLTGCECPNSDEPPPLPLEGDAVALAISGGPDGASGTLAGKSLDEFCNKGIAGTWTGTWMNSPDFGNPAATGGLTVTFTQSGTTINGVTSITGPTCDTGGKSTGTLTGNSITFGWLADPQRPVQFEGTVSGDSMSGTWNATACPPVSIPIYGTWQLTRTAKPSAKP